MTGGRVLSKHLSALLRFEAALAADCGGAVGGDDVDDCLARLCLAADCGGTIRGLAAAGARERGRSDGADRPLEARTKEFNTCASTGVANPRAQ